MGTVIQFKAKHQKPTYWSPLHPSEYLYDRGDGEMAGSAFVHQFLDHLGEWNVKYLFKAGLGQAPEQDIYESDYMHPEVFMMAAIEKMEIDGKKLAEWAEELTCGAFVQMCLANPHRFDELRNVYGKPIWHKETPSLQVLFDRMQSRAEAGMKRTT